MDGSMVDSWESFLGLATLLGYVLTLLLLPVVLLTKKEQPVSTVAWVMAIVTMPLVGGFLFAVFGVNRVAHRRLQNKQRAHQSVSGLLPPIADSPVLQDAECGPVPAVLRRIARRLGNTRAMWGNEVVVLHDADRVFEEIEAAIQSAQSSIHLEYYIWQPDRTGTRLRDLLIEKARAGVKVRFLFDTLGSIWLTRRFLEPMRDAGIHVATFVPGRTLFERWSINLRSHRKIIIVDGRVGFTGGMNVGDEYLGQDPYFGYWRDTHLRLQGPVVLQLQEVFALDWMYATREQLYQPELFPVAAQSGSVTAQVLAGGPDDDESTFHTLMFAAINEARLSVTLMTSYFVPPPAIVTALEAAALRGVRVRIMVSGPKTYWFTRHACRSYYETLLQTGVEIYEYRRGQQHAKSLAIDNCWSLVGTPNCDSRSLFLNFEVAVAIYDAAIAEQLHEHFDLDTPDALKIELATWSRRSIVERLNENFCRMFSPVL
jgi:cardiolipin synthase A/B